MIVYFRPAEVYFRAADLGLWLTLLVTGGVLLACWRRAAWADTRAVTAAAVVFLLVSLLHLGHTVTVAVLGSIPANVHIAPADEKYARRLETAYRVMHWAVRASDVLTVAWAVAAGRRPVDTLE